MGPYFLLIIDMVHIGISLLSVLYTDGTNKDDFAINATAGIITVNAKNLSAAVTKSYSLQVLAIDGGTPANTGTANLNVCVGCESGGKNGNIGQTWSRAAFVGSLVSLVLLQQL